MPFAPAYHTLFHLNQSKKDRIFFKDCRPQVACMFASFSFIAHSHSFSLSPFFGVIQFSSEFCWSFHSTAVEVQTGWYGLAVDANRALALVFWLKNGFSSSCSEMVVFDVCSLFFTVVWLVSPRHMDSIIVFSISIKETFHCYFIGLWGPLHFREKIRTQTKICRVMKVSLKQWNHKMNECAPVPHSESYLPMPLFSQNKSTWSSTTFSRTNDGWRRWRLGIGC